MKRVLKTLILGAGGVVGLGALMPRRVTVERTKHLRASAEKVFPLIESFEAGWIQWSPYGTKRDPSVVFAYEGPPAGVGATQRWSSKKMGKGTMTITRADRNAFLAYELDILSGTFRGEASFELAPHADGCDVTWKSTIDLGPNPLKRWLGVMIRRGMGGAFDEGLVALERAATE